MVSILDFQQFKDQNKYFDLFLNIDDKQIKVHRLVICPKSKYLDMLLINKETKQKDNNPVGILDILLPSNITYDDILEAIDCLYGIKKSNCSKNIIDALMFLMVDYSMIIIILQNIIKIDKDLSPDHINLIERLIKSSGYHAIGKYNELYPLIEFYGRELSLLELSLPNDILIFGNNFRGDYYFNNRNITKSLKLSSYEPDDIKILDSQWYHFNKLKSGSTKFTALGIDWSLNRHLHSFSYGDEEDLLHLYVDESYNTNQNIQYKIRVLFVIFLETRKSRVKMVYVDNLLPNEYKVSYMSRNYKPNEMTMDLPFDNKRVRLSLLIEHISINK
jgi:hypothetical protein